MAIKGGVTSTGPGMDAVIKAVDRLTRRSAYVGIPAVADPRNDGSPFGNAAIGYTNEMGAPERNLPPRPHLLPGVKEAHDEIVELLRKAGQAALKGDSAKVDLALAHAGEIAIRHVKNMVAAGLKPPLAPATVREHLRARGLSAAEIAKRKNPAPGVVDPSAGENPLILTGAYLQALTYLVADHDALA